MILSEWALRWGIPYAALEDLRRRMNTDPAPPAPSARGKSEAWVQSVLRLEASRQGARLWRNNVGALPDPRGVPVRFGLANESAAANERIKSADLIGIRPILIQPQHCGSTFGLFVSRECKAPGWRYTGEGREPAQLAWANLVNALGGDAGFATGGALFRGN